MQPSRDDNGDSNGSGGDPERRTMQPLQDDNGGGSSGGSGGEG